MLIYAAIWVSLASFICATVNLVKHERKVRDAKRRLERFKRPELSVFTPEELLVLLEAHNTNSDA